VNLKDLQSASKTQLRFNSNFFDFYRSEEPSN